MKRPAASSSVASCLKGSVFLTATSTPTCRPSLQSSSLPKVQQSRISGTVISLGAHGLRIGFSTFPVSPVLGELQVGSSTISPSTASETGFVAPMMCAFGAGASPMMDLASRRSGVGSRGILMGDNASANSSALSYSSGEVIRGSGMISLF